MRMKKLTAFKNYVDRKLSLSSTATTVSTSATTVTTTVPKSSKQAKVVVVKSTSIDLAVAAAAAVAGKKSPHTKAAAAAPEPYWILLITANVGSVFEYTDEDSETWFEQIRLSIADHKPMFVALHCQEMGGKNFATIRVVAAPVSSTGDNVVGASHITQHSTLAATNSSSDCSSNNSHHRTPLISTPSVPGDMEKARASATHANHGLIRKFTARLVHKFGLCGYDPVLILVDSDVDNQKTFTALGNFYFVRVADVPGPLASLSISSPPEPGGPFPSAPLLWNFETQKFEQLSTTQNNNNSSSSNATAAADNNTYQRSTSDNEFQWLNIEPAQMHECRRYYEKQRFPPQFFTHARWSRKGYMRTRWQLVAAGGQFLPSASGTSTAAVELDLCNVHLFHNVDNVESLQCSPSIYAQSRARALYFILQQIGKNYIQQQEHSDKQFDTLTDADNNTCTNVIDHKLDSFINECCKKTTSASSLLPYNVLLAIFGDYNFRIDLKRLLDDLKATKKFHYAVRCQQHHQPNDDAVMLPSITVPAVLLPLEHCSLIVENSTTTTAAAGAGGVSGDAAAIPTAVAPGHQQPNSSSCNRYREVVVSAADTGVDVLKIAAKVFQFTSSLAAGEGVEDLRYANILQQLFPEPSQYTKNFLLAQKKKLATAADMAPIKHYDNEAERFRNILFEYESTFGPTYPLSEALDRHDAYLGNRPPSWCDRILLGASTYENIVLKNKHSMLLSPDDDLLKQQRSRSVPNVARNTNINEDKVSNKQESSNASVKYSVIGADVCMGDHKPVFLLIPVKMQL